MTAAWPVRDRGRQLPKNPPGLVNLPPGAFVYKMSATETPSSDDKHPAPADEAEGMMARSHANSWGEQTPATAQAGRPRSALAVYPLRQ